MRRAKCWLMNSARMGTPAGSPSMMVVRALPCDSPAVRNLSIRCLLKASQLLPEGGIGHAGALRAFNPNVATRPQPGDGPGHRHAVVVVGVERHRLQLGGAAVHDEAVWQLLHARAEGLQAVHQL